MIKPSSFFFGFFAALVFLAEVLCVVVDVSAALGETAPAAKTIPTRGTVHLKAFIARSFKGIRKVYSERMTLSLTKKCAI
jgi:hypothetical protein